MKLRTIYKLGIIGSILLTAQVFADNSMNSASPSNPQSSMVQNSDTVANNPAENARIVESLQSIIKNNPTLAPLNVNVASTNGIVKISGNVDSDTQASLIVTYAESLVGVTDVDASDLQIKQSNQPFTDMMTTAKIRGVLIREKLFGEKDVAAINTSVETKNGVVYLSGQTDNKQQINNAIEIIKKNVSGITKIEYNVIYPIPSSNTTSNMNQSTSQPSNY